MDLIACLQKVTKEQSAEKLMDQAAMCALLSADGVPPADAHLYLGIIGEEGLLMDVIVSFTGDALPVRIERAAEAIASKLGADPAYVNRIITAMVSCME